MGFNSVYTMKKFTRVQVTLSSVNGDIYIADDRTFGWVSPRAFMPAEKQAYLVLQFYAQHRSNKLPILVYEEDLTGFPPILVEAVWTILRCKAFKSLMIFDKLNPRQHTGRYKATAIRNLMRLPTRKELVNYAFPLESCN